MHYECRCVECHCEPGATQTAAASSTRSRRGGSHSRCARSSVVSEPPLGSHLVSPRLGYTHQGIYVGQGRVVHYAGLSRRVARGPVEEVTLEAFARGRGIAIRCKGPLPFAEQEVVARARSRIGEDLYRIWSNNCEHFSEWSQFGESRSEQVERLIAPLRRLQRTLFAMANVFWSRASDDFRVPRRAMP